MRAFVSADVFKFILKKYINFMDILSLDLVAQFAKLMRKNNCTIKQIDN